MTYDKELYAIVQYFKMWRYYLKHAQHTTRMLSDHNNLKYFMYMTKLNDC
jgi:hypothetical protein